MLRGKTRKRFDFIQDHVTSLGNTLYCLVTLIIIGN